MVWFKIDDGFWSHSKVLELSSEAGWLWARAGAYCANQLTDGKVTAAALRMLAADRDAATELVIAGLWDIDDDGAWWFHDWAEYQPTREQVLAERAAATERKRRSRESRRTSQGESHRDTPGDSRGLDAVIPASPTRPDPTRPLSTSDEVESPREARSPFCSKHQPNGPRPGVKCRDCGTARMAHTAALAAERSRPLPEIRRPATCDVHAEYPLPCARCAEEQAVAS